MQQERIRVVVVDDHRIFAEALASRLADEPDLDVVGTATASDEALQLLSQNRVDVVALDLGLGSEDGLTVGRQLRDQWPALGIVVLNAGADDTRVVEAVQMGVRGWVAKRSGIESLLAAVRGAARGETHVPADLLTQVLVSLSERGPMSTPETDAVASLTAREIHVLRCLIEGMSRQEIGALLHVAPNTVRTHIQSILGKLNVHSALTAVAVARRAGVSGVWDERADSPQSRPWADPKGSPVGA